MLRLIILVIVFIEFLALSSSAQYERLYGRVLDSNTRDNVQFANISIKGSYLGTCSNIAGEFILNYPDSLKDNELVISCLGYKNDSILLSHIRDSFIVHLEPLTYSIAEVVITPKPKDAEELLKLVIKNLRRNYNKKPYFMEGFIRDRVYNIWNNENTRLTEAAINVEKDELSKKKYRDRVKVVEIRNSLNYSKLQGKLIYKIKKAFFGWDDSNPIYLSLQYADYTSVKILKDLLKDDYYSFSISDYSTYEGEPIVVINIKEDYRDLFGVKYSTQKLYDLIKIYVNIKSYAIVKSEYFKINKVKPPAEVYLKQDTIHRHSIKQYINIKNHYYLRYAGYYGKIHDQPSKESSQNIYLNETQLLINNIISDKKEFDRIKRRNLLRKDISLWDMEYTYHPEFWENYNIIIDKPLDKKVKLDLEHDVLLKKQFEETGSK